MTKPCAQSAPRARIVAMESWRGNSRGPVIAFLNQFKDRLDEINFDRAGVGAYFADDFEQLGFRNVNGIARWPTICQRLPVCSASPLLSSEG